jgi:sulfoacetaldehyde acetyltransferase
MELISKADVVLALGTRLNPFSTLPGYGIDYWPKGRQDHPGRHQPDRIGLTKKVTVGIRATRRRWLSGRSSPSCPPTAGDAGREDREALIAPDQIALGCRQLSSMDHEDDDPGTTWNERARAAEPDWMSPRMAWRAIQKALPKEAIISSDIGNNCAIGNAYPTFERAASTWRRACSVPAATACRPSWAPRSPARTRRCGLCRRRRLRHLHERTDGHRARDWPAITMVIFRNYQWGAEKRNSTLWFDDNFVGTELTRAWLRRIAKACGLKGVRRAPWTS